MLNVRNDMLVVEQKGIYSIEQFLIARRLMYWQVYFHKTGIAAEQILIKILKRAKELYNSDTELNLSPSLAYFMDKKITIHDFLTQGYIEFSKLDDYDIIFAIKQWQYHEDFILSKLSQMIINRELPKIKITKNPPTKEKIDRYVEKSKELYPIEEKQLRDYFIFSGEIRNIAYNSDKEKIMILTKTGKLSEIIQVSDQFNLEALSKPVIKYYICYPKEII